MKTNLLKSTSIILSFLFLAGVGAQDTHDDKEVIIIEKTIYADGNVISKKIRRNQGDLSDEELERMLQDDSDMPLLRSFDLEGMGFDDAFGNFFQPRRTDTKLRLGVMIDHSSGYAEVIEVQSRSGAAEADLRAGDRFLIVRGESVASIEDIATALEGKKAGESVRIKILRDGQELEKDITLSGGRLGIRGNSLLEFPGDMDFQFFEDSGEGSAMMDSLISRMRSFNFDGIDFDGIDFDGIDFDGFDMDQMLENRDQAKNLNKENNTKPQLGLLIDQEGSIIVVSEVIEDGPSEAAGIEVGDVIVRFDDNIIGSFRELRAMMNTKEIGGEVILTVDRNGKEKEVRILLK